jgi:F0F1-type ATP synthase membrane subunit c/vacuolar-type H+-ATPase subunit K
MSTAQEAVKVVRILHGAFLISIPIYAAVGEFFGQTGAGPGKIIRGALIALSLMNVGIAQLFAREMVTAAEEALARNASDDSALGRWRQGHLITFVLCESVALFGFVFRMLGGDSLQAAPLYVLSFALLLIWVPRPEFARQ